MQITLKEHLLKKFSFSVPEAVQEVVGTTDYDGNTSVTSAINNDSCHSDSSHEKLIQEPPQQHRPIS